VKYERRFAHQVKQRSNLTTEEHTLDTNPVVRLATLALLLAISPSAGVAQGQPPPPPDRTDLGFLEVGRSYLIRFPEDRHPVQLKESEITAQASGPPATWRMNYQVNVFVVRRLGGGSWALLEHPVDPKAATDIMSARSLLADKAQVAKVEADPDRKDFLARRREAARGELKMTQTWINLSHAISISDPPAEELRELKFNIEAR
jgi:hypothetical protein